MTSKPKAACLLVGLMLLPVSATAGAKSSFAKPALNWLASSVPQSSKIDLSKIVVTDSMGRKSFAANGNCTVNGNNLVTNKVGKCKFQLTIAATSKHSAISASTTLDVKKKVELSVLATVSLSKAIEDLRIAFTAKFLHASVRFNFSGSSTLVTQIQQGARVDIVALADTLNMDKIVTTGEIDKNSVTILVRNKLAILVQRGNPLKISDLNDLTRSGLKVVLCDVAQPCGKYAESILSKAKVSLTPVSRESSASGVVSRIASGEADAGIAYITDGLISGDKVDAVVIADALNVVAQYPIGVAKKPQSKNIETINSFIEMAKSKVGREIFSARGFIVS